MALSPQALVKGLVSRTLTSFNSDSQNNDVAIRQWSRGEAVTVPMIRKQSGLAEEGSYFSANNAQTAITGPAGSAFSHTAAALVIYNSSTTTNPVRIALDNIFLTNGSTAFSNTTSNTAMWYAMTIDSGNRVSSGGTSLTPKNVNMESGNGSVAAVTFGAVTSTTQTGAVRTIVGQRVFREPVSGTAMSLANLDTWTFNFGGVEGIPVNVTPASATVQANVVNKVFSVPPVIIGPGQSFLLHIWLQANSGQTGGTIFPDIYWYER